MSQFLFLLDANGSGTSSGIIQMLVLYAAIFGIFWFFLIRPQRKRQRETESMQNSIENGDEVLTNGGFYGKVVDKINDVYVVEFGTNKTVRVHVHKSAITSKSSPDLSVSSDEE